MHNPRFSYSRTQPVRSRSHSLDLNSIDVSSVYETILPGLRQTTDEWAWACCPFHNDNNPSFSVNTRTGAYRCMSSSCGANGRNLVSFVSAYLACETQEAIAYLEEHHG